MSSPLLDLPFAVSINNTLGALYVGNVLVAIFFGITSAQVFLYFMRNPKDKLIYKIAVAVLWMIDTLHLVFVTHAGYHYGIINYGNPVALLTISWSLIGQVVLTTTSDAIVRSILAHRVWLLSGGNVFLLIIIIIASCSVFAGGMMFAARAAQVKLFTRLVELSWILYFALGTVCVADIIISASLCVLLKKQGSRVFSKTKSIVKTLMLYSINGSALTSLCAVICLITYSTMPTNFIFEAIYFILPKLYLNSLLATMNARKSLRQQTHTSGDLVSIPLSKTTGSQAPAVGRSVDHSTHNEYRDTMVNIRVETTLDRKYDGESLRFEPDTPSSLLEHKGARRSDKWTAL